MLILSSFSLKPAPLGAHQCPGWPPAAPMAPRPPTQLGEGLPEAEGARGHQAGRGPSWELSFLVWSTAGFLLKQTFFATFSLCVPSNILLQFPTQKKSLKKKKAKGIRTAPWPSAVCGFPRGIQVCADGTAYGALEPSQLSPSRPL